MTQKQLSEKIKNYCEAQGITPWHIKYKPEQLNPFPRGIGRTAVANALALRPISNAQSALFEVFFNQIDMAKDDGGTN